MTSGETATAREDVDQVLSTTAHSDRLTTPSLPAADATGLRSGFWASASTPTCVGPTNIGVELPASVITVSSRLMALALKYQQSLSAQKTQSATVSSAPASLGPTPFLADAAPAQLTLSGMDADAMQEVTATPVSTLTSL